MERRAAWEEEENGDDTKHKRITLDLEKTGVITTVTPTDCWPKRGEPVRNPFLATRDDHSRPDEPHHVDGQTGEGILEMYARGRLKG